MLRTRIVNLRKEKYDVYIARPSKWGNPFKIGRDGDRNQVIELYRNWVVKQRDLMSSLNELKGKCLGCFCKPKRCHGDILVRMLKDV